jgi:hypothetical protein
MATNHPKRIFDGWIEYWTSRPPAANGGVRLDKDAFYAGVAFVLAAIDGTAIGPYPISSLCDRLKSLDTELAEYRKSREPKEGGDPMKKMLAKDVSGPMR